MDFAERTPNPPTFALLRMRRSSIALCLALLLVGCGKDDGKRSRSDDEAPTSGSAASAAINASALPPRGEPPGGWTLLAPPGAGYSVFVPGVAEKLDTGMSELHAVKRPSGSAYMAMCMTTDEPDEAFKGMRRGKIGERKLLSAKPMTDGRKGERLAIELETDKGILVSNELLLLGKDRVCSFSALVPRATDEGADVDRFFASARLEN
jgi:hypothetical protein